ncbi:3-hydroxyacyl-CoA dehydrogenase NAD-binding domain-containing protein [Marinovum sp. 2_MG-2023]|uniref:3-hydroxyacyl-CoA dehydrogenase family protein n=1 Tax=Roseobacteraceae TaxID=2854170 RepID=UPI001FD257EE|nr:MULTISPECIES: 3-hydroxyacyl-CoA dehydrogenase NAD-binding domain-containing protein [Roseobacteraceae]MCJ7875008.1 3-hydroxyacyl-CoA dehydrogenase NAD-binding domain-containing protein [Phaeobacter sp. J2-8]MDO6730599.1 3-hydroxyacyl-CoA dehydrogenase NAD-binding domain-containing protein [Marinovum sp. 2_MG-2023]MDO6778749.1 3-hydroxyacyl-CoA dehydrogenase NAD-binding domain-containing protein [Marinovum sp. 1_MG-2023]
MVAKKQQIAVIGAGLMGHGIALTLAKAGQYVAITDPFEEARASVVDRILQSMEAMGDDEKTAAKAMKMIEVFNSTAGAVRQADVVFEAAPEKLALKQQIFAEVEQHAPDSCILASNTSVMPITQIMSKLRLKNRAVGTHWWNPPHMIPLVEVVKTEWTDPTVAKTIFDLLADAGKTPVMVEKDVPGFIGNRLQHALWREAVSLVENGICEAEDVDTVVKSCFGRRLAVLGPLENADLVGTDLTLDIHENVLHDLESRKGPSPYLAKLVEDGRLGMKSGEGFRKWTKEDADAVRARVASHLNKLGTILDD